MGIKDFFYEDEGNKKTKKKPAKPIQNTLKFWITIAIITILIVVIDNTILFWCIFCNLINAVIYGFIIFFIIRHINKKNGL